MFCQHLYIFVQVRCKGWPAHRSIGRVFCIQTGLSEQSSLYSEWTSSADMWNKI